MAWGKKRAKSEDGFAAPVEIALCGNGMMIAGTPTSVSAFIDDHFAEVQASGNRSRRIVADGAMVTGNLGAFRQTHREYFELSERSRHLIEKYGEHLTKDGNLSGIVRDKSIAGHLDFKRVNLGPAQALCVQAAVGQLALRAAIKDVGEAIERVEGKVDKLAELAEAKRLGDVFADRSTLQPLVDRVRNFDELSSTDWATVASLGPVIARDIEALRAYIVKQLRKVKTSTRVRKRAEEAELLTDQLLQDSISLLALAEYNYTLWQSLRCAHAAIHEPNASGSVSADTFEQLSALSRADQEVVDRLQDVADRLAARTRLESLAPLKRRALGRHVAQLDEVTLWFCDQRNLDNRPIERPDQARLVDSLGKVGETVASAARTTTRVVAATPSRVRALTTSGPVPPPPPKPPELPS